MKDNTTSPAASRKDAAFDSRTLLQADFLAQAFAQMFEPAFESAQSPVKVADSTHRMWQKYSNSRLRHFANCQ